MSCKICEFFRKYPYRQHELTFFEVACREGKSLRTLSFLLKSYGLDCSKDTINKHIKLCMGAEVPVQRTVEKDLKKETGVLSKLRSFFPRPELPEPEKECLHLRTQTWADVANENLVCQCIDCKKILGSSPMEGVRSNPNRDSWLYRGLRR